MLAPGPFIELTSDTLIRRYFNYRSTQYYVNEGFYNFLNWFDERAWYPLGRIIGGTIYPGPACALQDPSCV